MNPKSFLQQTPHNSSTHGCGWSQMERLWNILIIMILFLKRLHSLNYTFIQTQDFFYEWDYIVSAYFPAIEWDGAVNWSQGTNTTRRWIFTQRLSKNAWHSKWTMSRWCLISHVASLHKSDENADQVVCVLIAAAFERWIICRCRKKKKSRNLHNTTIKIVFLSWHFRKTKRSKCQAIIKNDLTIKLHISTAADCYYRFRYETFNDWVIAALIRSAPITFSTNSYAHAEVFFLSEQVLRNL